MLFEESYMLHKRQFLRNNKVIILMIYININRMKFHLFSDDVVMRGVGGGDVRVLLSLYCLGYKSQFATQIERCRYYNFCT